MTTHSRSLRLAAVLMVLAGSVVPLTGCSSAGGTTCSDFGAMGIDEQTSTLRDLLEEHDLEPNDMGNMAGVSEAVDEYCASDSGSGTLDNAADWDSPTW